MKLCESLTDLKIAKEGRNAMTTKKKLKIGIVGAGAIALCVLAAQAYTIAGAAGVYRRDIPGKGFDVIKISITGQVHTESHFPFGAAPLIFDGVATRHGDIIQVRLGPELPAGHDVWLEYRRSADGRQLLYNSSRERAYSKIS